MTVTDAQWARMSWHARRAYEARGGRPPAGQDREARRRRALAAAGLDEHTIEVMLGHRPPTYLDRGRPLAQLSPADQARETQLELAHLVRRGVTHVVHDVAETPDAWAGVR